jgi:hypothetical protein
MRSGLATLAGSSPIDPSSPRPACTLQAGRFVIVHFGTTTRRSGCQSFELIGFSHPDPVSVPGRRSALTGPIAWGRCPLARRKGSLTLDRDGLPGLPRGCLFLTLDKSFDPLVQAG